MPAAAAAAAAAAEAAVGEGSGAPWGVRGGLQWLVIARMMNMRMANQIESYLWLGLHNADSIRLTELQPSSPVQPAGAGCRMAASRAAFSLV
jgi:hypothetical protein